jgi:hypothetical protein
LLREGEIGSQRKIATTGLRRFRTCTIDGHSRPNNSRRRRPIVERGNVRRDVRLRSSGYRLRAGRAARQRPLLSHQTPSASSTSTAPARAPSMQARSSSLQVRRPPVLRISRSTATESSRVTTCWSSIGCREHWRSSEPV